MLSFKKNIYIGLALINICFIAPVYGVLSPTPEQDKVCFYHGDNFKGTQVCYKSGQNIRYVGVKHNDEFTSVRVYGNALVRVYEKNDYKGKGTIITMDSYRFGRFNDAMSSLKVTTRVSDDHACLYEHEGYRGTPICIQDGGYVSNLGRTMVGRNKVSSVQVAGNARVDVYEDKNFKKKKWSYYFSEGQMSKVPNDNADSFKVFSYTKADRWNYFDRMFEQRRLSDKLPVSRSYQMSSHNSFNVGHYRTFPSPLGPNQEVTISEQLQLGVRFLEFDLHHTGVLRACHAFDCKIPRTRIEVPRLIAEIHNYLKGNNPNDFITIFIENHMETQKNYNYLKSIIKRGLGDYVYRPSVSAEGCQNTPYNKSIDEMRATGKRVLILGVGCSEEVVKSGLNQWAFKTGHSSRNADDKDEAMSFYGSTILSDGFMRISECWHSLCKSIAKNNDIPNIMQAGANVIGMDRINWRDDNVGGRLERQIWSWQDGEFRKTGSRYNVAAVSGESSELGAQFIAAGSSDFLPYACLMPNGEWEIAANTGSNIFAGTAACSALGGTFDLPLNSREARKLHTALPVKGKVFVNYGTQHGKRKAGVFNVLAGRNNMRQ